MKWIIVKGMFLACMVTNGYAYKGFDICNFGVETVSSVVCYGPAVLKGTTVSGDLKVTGPFTAEKITVSALNITGAADIIDSKVSDTVEVTGSLSAKGVEFAKGLTLTSDYIMLHKVKIRGSVTVNSSSNTPYMTMECGTTIRGDVTFTGKAGVIQITDDSVVQGKVNNGAMVFIKAKC